VTDILDLPDWSVISSHQDGDTYTIEAEYTKPLEACTKCGVIGRLYRHGTKPVTYRDAPIRGCHVQILARVQRYKCRDCGGTCLQILDGIRHDRRMTERCIEYIENQCIRDSFTRISEHVGCDEKTVRNVAQGFVDRFKAEYQPRMPEWLGIDETMLAGEMRGIFTDVKNRLPVDVIPGRDPKSVATWIMVNGGVGRIKGVATDMHRPYHNVIRDLLPGVPVVVDKFHVVRMAGNGVDQTRIRLGKLAGKKVNLGWKRSKILLNKAHRNLSDKQRFNLQMWLDNEPELAEAYQLKEDFYAIYDLPKQEANEALDNWIARASTGPLKKDFKELLSALKNWRSSIMAYFDYPITNGYTEALNGVAKVINRQGRGYTFDVIRVRVLGRFAPPKEEPTMQELIQRTSTHQIRKSLLEAADGQCQSCMGVFPQGQLAFHHVKPLAEGGGTELIVVCQTCNARLGDSTQETVN